MNKRETIEILESRIKREKSETKQKQLRLFKSLINQLNMDSFKGNDNLGHIAESIVLKYFDLKREDDLHEVKSLIINQWNTLKEESRQVCYVLVCCGSKFLDNGLYRIKADLIYDRDNIGIKELRALNPQKVCGFGTLIKRINERA